MQHVHVEHPQARTAALDNRLRSVFGPLSDGLTTGPFGVIAHFVTALTAEQEAKARAIVLAHGALSLSADKAQIQADGADTATITCADPRVAADTALTVTVWLDGQLYAEPAAVPVVAGAAQMTLATDVEGSYLIEVARQGADAHETGYITITARED